MTDNGFQGARSLHCILHSVYEWQILRRVPQSLIRYHEDAHETVGWIVDMLEFAVGVRRFVGYKVTSGMISF